MACFRLVARLDIKAPHLVKTVQLEGLRVVGDPEEYALAYYQEGVDELLYMDIVASLYGRNNLADTVERTTRNVFVPITVGGGIRSVEDARLLLRAGADKVAINTAAVKRPELISELARTFGSQCVVLSVEAKARRDSTWEAFTDNGRECTGKSVVDWVRQGTELGAGEVLLTSVDREGTRKGFDLALVEAVAKAVNVPVVASGGMATHEHLIQAAECGASAVAMADVLHFRRTSLDGIRAAARHAALEVRTP